MKQRYDENHLEYLSQWKAHFIKKDPKPARQPSPVKQPSPPPYEQLGAKSKIHEQLQTTHKEGSMKDPAKSLVTEASNPP